MSDVREAVLAALAGLSDRDGDTGTSRVASSATESGDARQADGDVTMRIDVEARTFAGDVVARTRAADADRTEVTADRTEDAADSARTDDRVVWSDGDVAVLDDDERTEGGEDR